VRFVIRAFLVADPHEWALPCDLRFLGRKSEVRFVIRAFFVADPHEWALACDLGFLGKKAKCGL
jgi:hypothetical protein